MYRPFLSLRYMLARPVSYLAIVAIAVAVMALITVWSIMNGFLGETRAIIRGTTADVVVTPFQDPARARPRAELEQIVTAVEGVEGAVSRFVRPAVFKVRGRVWSSMNSSLMAQRNHVVVLGIDVADELAVTHLRDYLEGNEDPENRVADLDDPFRIDREQILDRTLRNAGLPRVLVGEDLMRSLALGRGMALDLVTATDGDVFAESPQIQASSQTFIVAGAFRTGHFDTDTKQLFILRDDFRRWSAVATELSEVYVKLAPGAGLEQVKRGVADALRAQGVAAEVETWFDRNRVFLNAVENERNILAIVLGFFVLLTCTITFSMLTMMVTEKVRDIGILAAMGASPTGIAAVFAMCAAMVSGLGGLVGLAGGTALVIHVNGVKDWIEATFGIQVFRQDVYAFKEIPAELDMGLNAGIALVTVAFSILICAWPALRAGRLDPVEALRHE